MIPRFILCSTAAALLVACDRNATVDSQRAADLERQRQTEQLANEKIRQLESRLDDTEKQKTQERERELAQVKEDLAAAQRDKEEAAEKIRNLERQEAPSRAESVAEAPRGQAVQADVRRLVEEEEEAPEPVYSGRVVPETQRVTSINSFYQALDSQGDWMETDDYGYVFRPNAAARREWRPYTDGRWVYTDFGWTWESNEEFGWATYHYGRWARVGGVGWVWVPGKEWAPAWVSWRRGDDHYGWAPLPPDSRNRVRFTATVDRDYDLGPAAYTFVSLANFGARSYAPVAERPERNVTIINKTVNITNITYQTTNNETVVFNGGPRFEQVCAKSKQPVERINLSFAPQSSAENPRRMSVAQGSNLQLAAPPLPVASANTAPPRIKQKLGKPKLDKGWEGVETAQAVVMKEAMVSTSREKKPKGPRPANALVEPVAPKPAPVQPVAAQPVNPVNAAPLPVKGEKPNPGADDPRKRNPSRLENLPVKDPVNPQVPVLEAPLPKTEKPINPVVAPPNPVVPLTEAPRPKKSDRPEGKPLKKDGAVEAPPLATPPPPPTEPKPKKIQAFPAEAVETVPAAPKPSQPVTTAPPAEARPLNPNPTEVGNTRFKSENRPERAGQPPLRGTETMPKMPVAPAEQPAPGLSPEERAAKKNRTRPENRPERAGQPPIREAETTPKLPVVPVEQPASGLSPEEKAEKRRKKAENQPERAVQPALREAEMTTPKASMVPVEQPASGLTPEEKAEKKRKKEKERLKQNAAGQ